MSIIKIDDIYIDELIEKIVAGIKDFADSSGFKKAHLGLSGGIDSALVAYLAGSALGGENVCCINNPSRFSSQGSKDDAEELAKNLGSSYISIPIEECFTAFLSTLKPVFNDLPFDVTEENLQSRIRGVIWMAYSNKFGSMLLNASNKSEIAMGYCTLYGDAIGAVSPIGDLYKTQVFAMCKRINRLSLEKGKKAVIPEAIINKAPSAELRPNQKDEDSLPPYDVLDSILGLHLESHLNRDEIINKGWDAELVDKIIRTVKWAEFKRRQLPPAIKVSDNPF